ncbi:glycosyltransferase family 4 protein [Chlorogloeopsis sp. ULAP02]|uniref:glycosyltransferase family 4 protein n=1 Tax=Chlorogloeopsis sp. ULAP02 TaxID=3107926 RepID=UPI0031363548
MKSYLLVTGDFVKTGGMDRANYALADYLAKQGQQVHLVAHRVANELLAYPNVKFHRVPKVANSYLLSSPLLDWIGRLQAQRVAANGSRVLVNGGNCQWGDVNWVHYVHAAYHPNNQAGLLSQCKGAVSHQMFLDAERKACQSARVIIVNSNSTKRDLIKKLKIPEDKLHVVYYGIDPQIFYPVTQQERTALRQQLGWADDKPIVVFIGALGDRRKGFDTLFAAWQQLCASSEWDADLIVIGVGAELEEWQRRAVVAGINSRIHFLGFRSDVPRLLQAADCLVAPTRYEAYGLGVYEALCCGLPSIVSARAGVAERYPPQLQDLLTPNPEDAIDLAARLQKWSCNKHHYSNLVSSFSQKLRDYSWDDMARKILNKIE